MSNNIVPLAGIAILALCYLFEVNGIFMFLGYPAVRVISVLLATLFAVIGITFWKSRTRLPGAVVLTLSLVTLIFGWTLATLETSYLKRFYLLEQQIRPGDNIDIVMARFAGYPSWTESEGFVSFSCRSGTSNDVVLVRYDPTTSRVLESTYYFD